MPPATAGPELRIATTLGMDADARTALDRLTQLAKSRKIGVAGRFMPDAGVSAQLVAIGVAEQVDEADFFKFRTIVIPFTGVASRQRREIGRAHV